jgi:hypothetical protein
MIASRQPKCVGFEEDFKVFGVRFPLAVLFLGHAPLSFLDFFNVLF